jgi:metal-responsive CopG/Arc/MetJ family transcriptional regulator
MTTDQPERTERLQVFLSVHELAAIDEFRFENRMPNRAAAVRELLRHGLAAAQKDRLPRAN